LFDLDLNLVVSDWRQSANHYPRTKIEGRGLNARGRFDERELTLSDGTPLEKLSVELSIFETSRMQDHLSKLRDGAIGTLHYSPHQPAQDDIPALEAFVHGWLCLNAQLHHDVWNQVLMGGYRECMIRLSVGPIESRAVREWRWDVANNPALFIASVSVAFKRGSSL
jgi:hypothetical protein